MIDFYNPLLMTRFHRICGVALCALLAWPAHAQTQEAEDTTARYQSTYNWQYHPSFQSPYSGANSLKGQAESMYTFSATAHWGFRPWQNGELYFNPEVVSGVPFSDNLVGLGSFTNGEITRAGGRTPKLYRQRLFVRHTWGQGGERERVEGDFNQLAGWTDKNRVVLTAGNFSTLDVFDDNAYAKDPRTQFMNWGNWTYAAYDYAADARGYGWGAALEWYHDNWALRVGRMTGPKEPNGLPVDFAIGKHYGDQIEIERSHDVAGQPGKVRLLAWRNRAVVASFNDATQWVEQWKQSHPTQALQGPDALIASRSGEKTKYGLGVNVEQAINSQMGYFLRAMKADGHTETYAFTEADGSVSTGLVFKGGLWGRSDDTFGVAWLHNTLSSERRQFLQAGGISFFIGDSDGTHTLSYKPEQIWEAYYSWGLTKNTWLTTGYQRIQNPGYNADRGPVNVYALRFHAEI
jgi:high affinity Mn2+ porin